MSEHTSTPTERSSTDTKYGLPTPRDDQTGELLPDDHTFEWNEQEVTIKLLPPTLEQLERYQQFDENVETSQLREVVDTHIIEPDIEAKDMTVREVNCYIQGILDYGKAGGGETMEQVREAIERREGRAGNS